jgi:DNA-binding CsgD family transcriptional regulator
MSATETTVLDAVRTIAGATGLADLVPAAAACAGTISAANHGLVLIDTALASEQRVLDHVAVPVDSFTSRQKATFCFGQAEHWVSLSGERRNAVQPCLLFEDGRASLAALPDLRLHTQEMNGMAISTHLVANGGMIAAFIACAISSIPQIGEIALFHSLSTNLLSRMSDIDRDRQGTLVSERERQCLLWSARGKTSFEIAKILSLSEHTVNHYLTNATNKLDASNRAHAIVKAIRLGIVPIKEV